MVYEGCLSDNSIKAHCAEFFPLDIGSQEGTQVNHLEKHIFHGIGPLKTKPRPTFSRFPINDLKNFAQFAEPNNSHEAAFDAILSYRKMLGSHNYPQDIESAYENRLNLNYQPEHHATESTFEHQTPSASLTLYGNRMKTKTASDAFGQTIPNANKMYSAVTRTMLSKLTETNDYQSMHAQLASHLPPRGQANHDDIVNALGIEYRDDTKQLAQIETADRDARKHHKIPLNLHQSLTGSRFSGLEIEGDDDGYSSEEL